jgi:tetratricopeptide (TPR) repeat protein
MKRIIIAAILLLSFVNVYSNSNDKTNTTNDITESQNQYDKLIDLARTYFNKNTEYAFNCTYKAHAIAEENHDNKKSAECNIIMGDIFKENNSFPTAISYYEKAIENLDVIKEYHTIYKLYIKIANLYQNSEFESKWSVEALNNALKYANFINEASVYNEIYMAFGNMYFSQNKYDLAKQYYNKILDNDINKITISTISTALTKKANVLIHEKEYDNAMYLIDSSLYLCIRDFNDSLQVINYNYKAQIYDSINDIESAKKYYLQSAKLAYSTNDFHTCGESMFALAHLNLKKGDYDNAIDVFKIICDSTEKYKMYNICHKAYYQLSQCYASLGQYEDAYKFFNKYDIYYDSTYNIKQEEKINKLRNSYLLSLNIKELKAKEIKEESTKSNKSEWKLFISITIVLAMIIIAFIILYSTNYATSHKNKVSKYEQQLKIDKIENDLMEYQIKNNRELIFKLALQLKSYIDIINPIKDELKSAIELPESEQKNKVKTIYHNIQNNIQIFHSTENLNKQIDDIYKDFLERLESKHPGLTKAEKKLCTMLYINMSSKEIAATTNTTTRTVETSRYRLRRKFNLSRDEDIVDFLQKI